MAQYKCVTKCYYRDRIWNRGDVLNSIEDEEVPKHFVLKEAVPVEDVEGLEDEPETFTELQKKEAKELAESGADPTVVAPEEGEPEEGKPEDDFDEVLE